VIAVRTEYSRRLANDHPFGQWILDRRNGCGLGKRNGSWSYRISDRLGLCALSDRGHDFSTAGAKVEQELGRYYVVDLRRNSLVEKDCDPAPGGSRLGDRGSPQPCASRRAKPRASALRGCGCSARKNSVLAHHRSDPRPDRASETSTSLYHNPRRSREALL
jgi:hypothetical protein